MKKSRLLLSTAAVLLATTGAQAGTLYVSYMQYQGAPNPSQARGTGFLILNDAQTSATVYATHNIATAGTSPLTLGHIHRAPLGVNGPVIFGFTPVPPVSPVGPLTWAIPATETNSSRATTLEELSGRTLYSAGRQAVEAMEGFQGALFDHAEDMAGVDREGFAGFVGGGLIFGKRDTDSATAGAKTSRPFVMAGFDYGMGEGASAGLSVGYADGKDEFRGNLGETGVKTTSIAAHFAHRGGGVNFAAVAGYGFVKADTSRSIASLSRTATGEHDGKVFSIGAKVSMPITLDGESVIAPYGLLDYHTATMDAYAETGASSVGLVVPEHKDKQAAAELGAAFHVPMGADDSVGVRLAAGYRYLLEDGKSTISTQFVGSSSAFTTLVRSPGMSGVRASAHLTGKVNDNMTFSAGYNGLISGRTKLHALEARLTLKM